MEKRADTPAIHAFGLKYADLIIGVVLGLGFQWWPNLTEPWQYLAFIFVYLNLIDYWVDYSPLLRKFPLRREADVILHTYIIFTMFFMIYGTHKTISYFLMAFVLYRIGDLLLLLRIRNEHRLDPQDRPFVHAWLRFEFVEAVGTALLLFLSLLTTTAPIFLFLLFVVLRIFMRSVASLSYHKAYYARLW